MLSHEVLVYLCHCILWQFGAQNRLFSPSLFWYLAKIQGGKMFILNIIWSEKEESKTGPGNPWKLKKRGPPQLRKTSGMQETDKWATQRRLKGTWRFRKEKFPHWRRAPAFRRGRCQRRIKSLARKVPPSWCNPKRNSGIWKAKIGTIGLSTGRSWILIQKDWIRWCHFYIITFLIIVVLWSREQYCW